jgi:hypothetical protein
MAKNNNPMQTSAYLVREYQKLYGEEPLLSREELISIINTVNGMGADGYILSMMALHSRVNRHSARIEELEFCAHNH